jgi:hypothetical protein
MPSSYSPLHHHRLVKGLSNLDAAGGTEAHAAKAAATKRRQALEAVALEQQPQLGHLW